MATFVLLTLDFCSIHRRKADPSLAEINERMSELRIIQTSVMHKMKIRK